MQNLDIMNLSNLWLIARNYGRVLLRTNQNDCYFAQIVFEPSKNSSMIASSDYNQKSPEAALAMAIKEAREMSISLSNLGII